jgi:hypothetical protein
MVITGSENTSIEMPSQSPREKTVVKTATLYRGNALDFYATWPTPTVIFSDGAYGVKGFPGDPPTPTSLDTWYEPHIKAWSEKADGGTTLWFWNTEIGWAMVHPMLVQHGWEYRGCNIWDKGVGHIAGNANSKTLRKFPVVTEVCAHYTKAVTFKFEEKQLSMQKWLRAEWLRTGLPLSKTNEACDVANAATRKYFTDCHLWYYPPVEMFEKFVTYANQYGEPSGRPYFSTDGQRSITGEEWGRMRAKFKLSHGITNVWNTPPVRGSERLKSTGSAALHSNQKPLTLTERIILATSDPGDVIWDPFGGLATTALASILNDRRCYTAEIADEVYKRAVERLRLESQRLL